MCMSLPRTAQDMYGAVQGSSRITRSGRMGREGIEACLGVPKRLAQDSTGRLT